MEDNFFMDRGGGGRVLQAVIRAMVQAVMGEMGSDGEQWGVADESLLTPPCPSPPAVRPGS